AAEGVFPADRAGVQERTGLGPRVGGRILARLADVAEEATAPGDLAEAAVERAEAQRRMERSRVEMVRSYAETDRCRTQFMLGYFGQETEHPCGHCDRCRAGTAE